MAKKGKKIKKKVLTGQRKNQPLLQPEPEKERVKQIKIRLIGIGGGGGNIVAEISQRTKAKISFIVVDTDLKALKELPKSVEKFHFGQNLTQGLGTGMNPALGAEAAKKEKEEIKKILMGQDLVILVATLGGGVGSGASPVFSQISKNLGDLTYGIFTLPFLFEGKRKREIAREALVELKRELNAFSVLPNERIFRMIEKTTPLVKAFSAVNKSLTESIQNLTEIIFRPALINIDFADLRTIFEGRGSLAYLNSIQIGDGEKEKEIEKIIYSPLYPYSIGGAKGILFNIAGQKDLPLTQVSQISKAISEKVDREAKIIFGISRMEKNQGTRVTILATGASPDSEEIPENKRRLKKKLPQPKEKPPISSKKKREEKDKSKKESPPKIAEEVIRKNGLQLKKEIEKEETEILMKEKSWEAPAFLRRKRTT